MTGALIRELCRPRTGFLFVSILLFEVYYATQVSPGTGQNAWNVIYPAVTSDKFAVILGLLWWVFVLIENAQHLSSPDVLLRSGSRLRAVQRTIVKNVKEFAVGVLVVGAVSVAVGAPAGLSPFWSDATLSAAQSTPSPPAFTTLHGAQTFSSPPVAAGAFVMFSAIALMSLSIAHAAVCVIGKSRLASGGAMALFLWSASCTFGVAAGVPAINTSTLFDLEWASEQHAALLVVCVWVAIAGISLAALAVTTTSSESSDLLSRWWAVLIVPVAAFVFALGSHGATPQQRWDAFFAGQNDSLTGYVRAASLVYVSGTIAVMHHFDAIDEQFSYRHIRYGTWWHVLRPHLTRALSVTTVCSVSLTAAAALAVALTSEHPGGLDPWTIALTGTGVLLTTWVVTSVGLFVASVTRSPQSWVWVIAGGLVGGYAAFVPLGPFNVLALYSSTLLDQHRIPGDSFSVAFGFAASATLATVAKTVWIPHRNRTSSLRRNG